MSGPKPPFPEDVWARGAHEDFIWHARQPMETGWVWGRLHDTPRMLEPFNEAQIALWAIWNVDGQIHNGGFIQALENVHGELAEQAIAGFRLFGMDAHAALMAEGFHRFFDPVPLLDDERHWRLAELLNVDPDGTYEDVQRQIYRKGEALIGDVQNRYFEVRGGLDDYFRTLAHEIYERRAQFFDLSPGKRPGLPNAVKALALVAALLLFIFSIYLF